MVFSHYAVTDYFLDTDSFLANLGELVFSCVPLGALLICSSYFFLALFIFISTFFWKAFLHNKQVGLKKTIFVYGTSLFLTVFIPLSSYAYTEVMSSVDGLRLHQQWLNVVPEIRANYEISNFSEEPLPTAEVSKYEGIQVEFDLTIEKSGNYEGNVVVVPTNQSPWGFSYFGGKSREGYFTINYDQPGSSKHVSVFIPVKPRLHEELAQGPYFFSVILKPTDKNTMYREINAETVVITGDQAKLERETPNVPILYIYNSSLITRPYHYTDFLD